MTNMEVFYKQGRRYISLGERWEGWPSKGVWLVEDAHKRLIMRVGDVPDPMPVAQMERHRDAACEAIADGCRKGLSACEMWNLIILKIAESMQQ